MAEFTREQELLMRLRDERCDGNAAELARRLSKDATYVNRLLYPIGKKGRKGIGLEVMRAASEAFELSPGYWDGAASPEPEREIASESVFEALTEPERELLADFRILPDDDQAELRAEVQRRALKARAYIQKVFRSFPTTEAQAPTEEEKRIAEKLLAGHPVMKKPKRVA